MSLNLVVLKGRLARDPEMKTTQSGISSARFTLAVDRNFTDANGNRECDFVNCIAWRNTADFIHKYFAKGQEMCATGSLQVRSYEAQDGTKRTVTEVNVSSVDFCGKKVDRTGDASASDKFEELPDDDQLPF